MAVAPTPIKDLRSERAETSRLAWAFALSLALHLLFWGTWQAGNHYGLWQRLHWPAWMQSVKLLTDVFKKEPPKQPPAQEQELPLMFVNVNPAVATTEAPKDATFYSDKNSKAANPEAEKETNVPKITGTQTQVVKTEDVPRQKEFVPLQPARPQPPQPKAEDLPEVKAKPKEAPGDLTMAKPDLNPRKDEGKAEQPRPRTIKEALARQGITEPPGQKMKQEGGVRRRLELSSVDARATPFGAYDAALVEAVSQRWWSLLDQRDYASDGRGKVELQFVLHYDGRITDMRVAGKTVGEVLALLCEKAVLDPAPFPPWPSDMRRMLGETRNILFTFYYQ
jgi:hypothetical protein